jgi:hypothetical protein
VAKLDRLARNVRYLLQVIDDDLGHIPLMGDMPSIENNAAGRLQLSIMASLMNALATACRATACRARHPNFRRD